MGNDSGDEFTYTGAPQADQLSERYDTPSDQEKTSELVQWQASEFIDHQKSSLWILALIGAALATAVVVYLLTKDILSTVVILIGTTAFAMYAVKKPRTLTYTLSASSIKIGQRVYRYEDFKTFSVVQQGALFSILLEPVKRFMPPLTIYFDRDDGEKIFDALARHLPHEEKAIDFVEKLMRKIRF